MIHCKLKSCVPLQNRIWYIYGCTIVAALVALGEGIAQEDRISGDRVRFTDVTRQAGIEFRHSNGGFGRGYMPETMGSGCGFLDYDGDGDPDILLVNNMAWPEQKAGRRVTMALYRNGGDGTFADVTRQAGLQVEMYGMGCAVGDFDNDGDEDVYLACLGPNHLFRNGGDGTFADVTGEMGVGDAAWSVCAVWLDYDRDGDLDLFVGNYLKWTAERDAWLDAETGHRPYAPQLYEAEYPRLYRNDGARFTDVSEAAGVYGKPGKGMSAVALDYDRDGWPDILMSNDTMPDFLYRNQGDGTFTEEGILAGVAFGADGTAKSGMGVDAADARNTGRPDLAVGNFAYEMISLFRNEAEGAFTDRTVPSGVGRPSSPFVTFGVCFFDYDLDGRLDLFAATGHVESEIQRVKPHMTYAQRPLLFHNRGDGRFVEVGQSAGDLRRPLVGRGAAYADYDGDGDLDVLVSTNNGRPALFRNEGGNRNRALRVRVVGTQSNRSGIGTEVKLRAGSILQTRFLKAGSSYCSQNELVATFGLGERAAADEVEVVWPGGRVERFKGVAAGQTVTVREGEGIVDSVPFKAQE